MVGQPEQAFREQIAAVLYHFSRMSCSYSVVPDVSGVSVSMESRGNWLYVLFNNGLGMVLAQFPQGIPVLGDG